MACKGSGVQIPQLHQAQRTVRSPSQRCPARPVSAIYQPTTLGHAARRAASIAQVVALCGSRSGGTFEACWSASGDGLSRGASMRLELQPTRPRPIRLGALTGGGRRPGLDRPPSLRPGPTHVPCGRCTKQHAHRRRLLQVATPPWAGRLPAGRYPKTDAGYEDRRPLRRDPRR
jgi:hypothetical protein